MQNQSHLVRPVLYDVVPRGIQDIFSTTQPEGSQGRPESSVSLASRDTATCIPAHMIHVATPTTTSSHGSFSVIGIEHQSWIELGSSQATAETPSEFLDLWDQAFDEVEQDNLDMVTLYEYILSKEITPNASSPHDPFKSRIGQTHHQTRMKKLLEVWVSKVKDEEESKDRDQYDCNTTQQIIRKAVETTGSNASLAWVGLCYASRILLNPEIANQDDCLGLVYVISRMNWYDRLPRLLSQDTNVDDAQDRLRGCIIHLYKAVLTYVMNFICSHPGILTVSFPIGFYEPRQSNGVSLLETIKNAENALPLFNEESVYLPLMKQVSSFSSCEERDGLPHHSSYYYPDRSSEDSLEQLNEMLRDLHVDDRQVTLLDTDDNQFAQDLYDRLSTTDQYLNICNWEQKGNSLLWIMGCAVYGGSMLMKSISRNISKSSRSDSPPIVCYFRFDTCRFNASHAAAALRNLIGGVLECQPRLAHHLKSKRETTNRSTFDDPNDFLALFGILDGMMREPSFPSTYFVIDALDDLSPESKHPRLTELLQFIKHSIQMFDHIRWIVSTDYTCAIPLALEGTGQWAAIDISYLGRDGDLETYVREKVRMLAQTKDYGGDLESNVEEMFCERLPNNYEQVDLICEALTAEKLDNVENELDELLARAYLCGDQLYKYLYDKFSLLPDNEKTLCLEILFTTAITNRLSNISELEGLLDPGHRVDLRTMVNKCHAFLVVSDDGRLSFRHYDARDYLVRERVESIPQACATLIRHNVNSVVEILTSGTIAGSSAPSNSFWLLSWVDHLYDLIKSTKIDETDLPSETCRKVSSFLGEHSLAWLRLVSKEDLLAKATILLRKVDLLLNAENELGAAIRDALLTINFHMSTETPKYFSNDNMILARPMERISKKNYFQDDNLGVECLLLGNYVWSHEFGSLTGHTDCTRDVAFSHDGRLIASGSNDGSVRIWDAETWTTQHTLEIGSGWIYCVAFSSNGHIATGSNEGEVTIWDSSSGRKLYYSQEKFLGVVRDLAFSPDGRYLATALGHKVRVWHLNTGLEEFHDIEHDAERVMSISFSWDGKLLASGTNRNRIRIWNTWQKEIVSDILPPVRDFRRTETISVAFSPETKSRYLASGSDAGFIKIWALEECTANCIMSLNAGGPVDSLSFSPNGLQLATVVNAKRIDVWDSISGQKLATRRPFNNAFIQSIAFSPTGTYIASASSDSSVKMWYMTGANVLNEMHPQSSGVTGPVTEVAVSPNGRTIAAGHHDGKVILWNMNDRESLPIQLPSPHSDRVNCLAFSPDGSKLASVANDLLLWVYDLVTGKESVMRRSKDYAHKVAWSPEGRWLASASVGNIVRLHKLDGLSIFRKVNLVLFSAGVATYKVKSLAFSPKEENLCLAAGGENGKIVVSSKQEGEKWVLHQIIDAHSDCIRSLAYTPDGRRLLSSADDLTLRIWHAETGKPVSDSIATRFAHNDMRFEKDPKTWKYVMTDTGAQSIDTACKEPPNWCPYEYGIIDGRHYITRHGQQLIFLPRTHVPTARYFNGDTVIIGLDVGLVMVFKFTEKGSSPA